MGTNPSNAAGNANFSVFKSENLSPIVLKLEQSVKLSIRFLFADNKTNAAVA